MTHDEDSPFPEDRQRTAPKDFPKARRKRGAAEIEKRTAWLDWRIVCWRGNRAASRQTPDLACRSAEEIAADALQNSSPGIYALGLRYRGLNPEARGCLRVTPPLLAGTLEALQAARRYRKQLPRLVGDLDAWRSAKERRLQQVSKLVRQEAGREGTDRGLRLALLAGAESLAGKDNAFLSEYCWASGETAPAEVRAAESRFARAVEEIEKRVARGLPRSGRRGESREVLRGLTGRACAFASPDPVVSGVVDWLEACRRAGGGRSFGEICWMACRALEDWLDAAGWRKENVERLFELLPRLRPGGWPEYWRWTWTGSWEASVRRHRAIGMLGEAGREGAQRLAGHGLLETATEIAEAHPQRLALLAGVPEELLGLSVKIERRQVWQQLLSIPDERTIHRLLGFLRSQPEADRERALTALHAILLLPKGRFRGRDPGDDGPAWARHFWLFEELVRRHPWGISFREGAEGLFDLVRARESRPDEKGLRRMARAYLDAPFHYSASRKDLELCSELAGASTARFLQLVSAVPGDAEDYPTEALDGWSYLGKHPPVQRFLAACAGQRDLAPRIWRILLRLALAIRLQLHEQAEREIAGWASPPSAAALGPETPAAAGLAAEVAALSGYRALAGETEPLPKRLARLLHLPERREQELESLRRLRGEDRLTAAAGIRLAALEKEARGAAPEVRTAKLRRACERALREAKLRALEAGMDRVIRTHWRRMGAHEGAVPAGPEWDNALHLYASIRRNRRILRTLLVHEAAGGRDWIRTHPANVAWLDCMRARGVNVKRWLEGVRECHRIDGAQWELYTERRPLRVLQMGSLFSTCLRPGGDYAYSAVANAAEANKQVLYIRSPEGRILGRKLIALARPAGDAAGRGLLVGFRSYGACDSKDWTPRSHASPWVKILFDLACAKLAAEAGVRFEAGREELWSASETLALFAHWYNDGPEPPDWWTSGDTAEGLTERVIQELEDPDRESRMEQTLRALLYLGERAAPALMRCGREALPPEGWRFLLRWTQSETARRAAAGWAGEGAPGEDARPLPSRREGGSQRRKR